MAGLGFRRLGLVEDCGVEDLGFRVAASIVQEPD